MTRSQPRRARGTVGHAYSALNLRLALAGFGLVIMARLRGAGVLGRRGLAGRGLRGLRGGRRGRPGRHPAPPRRPPPRGAGRTALTVRVTGVRDAHRHHQPRHRTRCSRPTRRCPTEQIDAAIERADLAFRQLRGTTVDQRGRWLNAAADLLDAERDEIARIDDHRDGQDVRRGAGRGDQVRHGLPLLRRPTPSAFLADEPADADAVEGDPGVRPLPADRPGARGDAVELPALAGDAVRRAGADGRQHRPAQARLERAADRAATWRTCSAGPASRRARSPPCWSAPSAVERILSDPRVRAATLTGSEGAGRSIAADRRPGAEEDRAGTRRQRPVRGDALGRPGPGRRGGHHRPLPEQRPVLHRREAVHRAHRRLRRLRREVRREHGGAAGRRPDGRRHRRRAAGQRAAAATRSTRRCATRSTRAPRCSAAASGPTGDGWFYPPTVVTDLTPQMRMWSEEVFGPVAGLYRVVVVRGGDRGGQRHRVRARLQRLDPRPGRAGALRHRPGRRQRLHQRDDHVLSRSCRSAA